MLDAYILGIDYPIVDFHRRCIGVVHRTDIADDKLIVVADASSFSDEQIGIDRLRRTAV